MNCETCNKKIVEDTELFKVYEGTVKEALTKCLDDGRRPLTIKEIVEAKKSGRIKDQWYDSSSIYYPLTGDLIKDAPIKELREFLSRGLGGRVLFVDSDNYGLDGSNDLGYLGRFVGVQATESKRKRKKK